MHSILIQSLATSPAQDNAKQAKPTAEGEAREVSFDTVFGDSAEAEVPIDSERPEKPQIKGDQEVLVGDDADPALNSSEEKPDDPTKEAVITLPEQEKHPKQQNAELQMNKSDAPIDKVAPSQSPAAILHRPLDAPDHQTTAKTPTTTLNTAEVEATGTVAKRELTTAPVPVQTTQKPVPTSVPFAQVAVEQTAKRTEFTSSNSPETVLRQTDQPHVTQPHVKAQQLGPLLLEPAKAKPVSIEKSPTRLDQITVQTQQNAVPAKSSGIQPAVLPEQLAKAVLSSTLPQDKRSRFDALLPEVRTSKSSTVLKPNTSNFGQIAMAQPSVAAPATETSKASLTLDIDPLSASRSEMSSTTTTQSNQALPTRMELPHHVARQIAEALQAMPNRPVEIRLSPEELGRVRLGVSTVEGNIMVTVLAERPETGDLMRRHISALETAFQELGYSDISFAFGGEDNLQPDQESGDDQVARGAQRTSDETVQHPIQVHLNAAPVTGLDIRL